MARQKKNAGQKTVLTNSYTEVMKSLSEKKGIEITTEDLYNESLDKVIRIENEDVVKKLWENLKKYVNTKGVSCVINKKNKKLTIEEKEKMKFVYVRGHGRNGSGNEDLICILENVFQRQFLIDGSNNNYPQNLLKQNISGEYEDYQVSHLFERRTNNPLLFGAPWMICYCPKILDPFTGHETKGFPELTKHFVWWAFKINKKYIEDYNRIIPEYWKNLKEYFEKTNKYSEDRKKSMILTLAPLILRYEQMPEKDRKNAYKDLFEKDVNSWKDFIKNEQFKDDNGNSFLYYNENN